MTYRDSLDGEWYLHTRFKGDASLTNVKTQSFIFDNSNPEVDTNNSFNFTTDNIFNNGYVKVGDTVNITVTTTETLSDFTSAFVIVGGQERPATISGAGSSWTISYTLTQADTEGVIGVTIKPGSMYDQLDHTNSEEFGLGDIEVIFDKTAPMVNIVDAEDKHYQAATIITYENGNIDYEKYETLISELTGVISSDTGAYSLSVSDNYGFYGIGSVTNKPSIRYLELNNDTGIFVETNDIPHKMIEGIRQFTGEFIIEYNVIDLAGNIGRSTKRFRVINFTGEFEWCIADGICETYTPDNAPTVIDVVRKYRELQEGGINSIITSTINNFKAYSYRQEEMPINYYYLYDGKRVEEINEYVSGKYTLVLEANDGTYSARDIKIDINITDDLSTPILHSYSLDIRMIIYTIMLMIFLSSLLLFISYKSINKVRK